MLKIHRLKQPNMHSGTPLEPGESIEQRGMIITNKNKFVVHVDTFTRKPWKPSKKKLSEKKAERKAVKKAGKKVEKTEQGSQDAA